jgi:hypothetical protein
MATQQIGLFISERYLVETSVISENMNMALVRPTLIKVQEMKIMPAIGSPLYKSIENKIIAGTALTAKEEVLRVDYLAPAIVQWMYAELPYVLAYRFMNKNAVKRRSEESELMQKDELIFWVEKARSDAEWYTLRAVRYLEANLSDFPLFQNPTNAVDTIYPERQSYDVGMNMDLPYYDGQYWRYGSRNRCCY